MKKGLFEMALSKKAKQKVNIHSLVQQYRQNPQKEFYLQFTNSSIELNVESNIQHKRNKVSLFSDLLRSTKYTCYQHPLKPMDNKQTLLQPFESFQMFKKNKSKKQDKIDLPLSSISENQQETISNSKRILTYSFAPLDEKNSQVFENNSQDPYVQFNKLLNSKKVTISRQNSPQKNSITEKKTKFEKLNLSIQKEEQKDNNFFSNISLNVSFYDQVKALLFSKIQIQQEEIQKFSNQQRSEQVKHIEVKLSIKNDLYDQNLQLDGIIKVESKVYSQLGTKNHQ